MKSSKIISTNDNTFNIKASLDRLGAALIFPLSFLAFVSIFMGVSYIFPSDWFIVEWVRSVTGVFFGIFPYLVYISIIIIFIQDKDNQTILESLIFLLSVNAVYIFTGEYFEFEHSFNLFLTMITSFTFIYIYRYKVYKWSWVPMGALLSLIMIPVFLIVNILIIMLGNLIGYLPWGLNSFMYGFTNRLLLPFGLHSVMIPTFAYSSIGGYAEVYQGGELVNVINGDSPIWMFMYTNGIKDFALSGVVEVDGVEYTYQVFNDGVVGQYQQGFLPIITFAFPMVALTYCYVNGYENGKVFLMGALLTLCSGITETTEYFFILINPFLYLLNALMVGISFMLCNLLQVHVWLSTGWFIDVILFGIVPSIKGFHTHWYLIPIIGIGIGAIYSYLFILIDNKTKYELGR